MAGEEAESQLEPEGRQIGPGLIAAVVLAVVLAVFIFQNTDEASVTWLVFDARPPLWLALLVAAVAGAVLSELAGWAIHRRRRGR